MQNRVFFPQTALDQWIVSGTVELQKGELTIVPAGRRYVLEEAVRILREVSGGGDGPQLIGRVKTLAQLEQQGGEIVETSMLLGDAAYDVEPGWVGTPVGSFAEYLGSVGSEGRKKARGAKRGGEPKNDEELLARFLADIL